ncbi:MAG: hypothetical protein KH196_12940 [Oscillospiraceae bacterium]|jgi:hypothetical protein|nr:hypothetical protein [Oscillospiraceae bacterium]
MGALKMALVINGTSIPTSGKVVCNGTSLKQLNIGGTKVWNSAVEKQYSIYNTASRSGWWSSFGNGVLDSGLRYWMGRGQIFSPYIDLTQYTKITINLFIQISGAGSVELAFGFCRESAPNDWVWMQRTGVVSAGAWQGPNISGTYDISGLTGRHRIKQMSINGSGDTVHTFLGNSYFTYLE